MTDRIDRVDPPDLTIVTGAGGWLGRALVDHLVREGGPYSRPGAVRALVRDAEDLMAFASQPRVEPVLGDVRRPDRLAPLFAGLQGTVDVVHTAGVIHPDRTDDFEEVNARGTANVMAAALDHGVRRVVHVSSNSPFGTNSHPGDLFRNEEPYHPYYGYGQSKMDAELAVFDADHADPGGALRAARQEWSRRHSVHVADAYAWALHAAGRDREALGFERRALALGTWSASFHYHLGMIELSLGRRAAGAADLRTALRINPNFSILGVTVARSALAKERGQA